jgi:hypothetical protein
MRMLMRDLTGGEAGVADAWWVLVLMLVMRALGC